MQSKSLFGMKTKLVKSVALICTAVFGGVFFASNLVVGENINTDDYNRWISETRARLRIEYIGQGGAP